MRVLIVNTNELTGGAAVAANRLMEALNNNGVKAKMLVKEKATENLTVVGLPSSFRQKWNFLYERWCIFWHLHLKRNRLFEIDIANVGNDITRLREFKEADIIHLHWINQGMLSVENIQKILASGKPVVWTMHDLWPATAICHYANSCKKYQTSCANCPLLPGGGGANDLAAKVWRRKQKAYQKGNILFVPCSKWLERTAKESALLKGHFVKSVPNAIDQHSFCKKDKTEARQKVGLPTDKRIILFASQRITDQRKGIDYLVKALEKMVKEHPETRENTVVAILGGHAEDVVNQLPLTAFPLGFVSDEKTIVNIYNAADVFVLPSLQDNLPNTIMEALACGVPCVGFRVGGIPEEIDHLKNGYVAEYKSIDDLSRGIFWVLSEANAEELSTNAIRKVAKSYSQQTVALKYIEVYTQAAATKHFRL